MKGHYEQDKKNQVGDKGVEAALTAAQFRGISSAIEGFVEGSLAFDDVRLTDERVKALQSIADRFRASCPTTEDRHIARNFASLPYTREESYTLRWAQERAFAHLWGYKARRNPATGDFFIPQDVDKPLVAADRMYVMLDKWIGAHVPSAQEAISAPPTQEGAPTQERSTFPELPLGCDVAEHIEWQLRDMNDVLAACLPFANNGAEENVNLLDTCLNRAQELVEYIPKVKKLFGQD